MRNILSFAIIFVSLLFISCESEEFETSRSTKKLMLNADIEKSLTRVTDDSWEEGDVIGIYMKNSGQTLNSTSVWNENIQYVTEGTGAFEPKNEDETIYFPYSGASVDFIGYYPYQKTISNLIYPVVLQDQSKQSAIDLLYSDNATGHNKNNNVVSMEFAHQLTKIVVNFTATPGLSLTNATVMMSNVGTKAEFNLAEGVISEPTEMSHIILKTDADKWLAEAILLPQEDLSDVALWVEYEQHKLRFKFPMSNFDDKFTSFEKSKKYTFNITLNADLTASTITATIANWTEGPSVTDDGIPTDEEMPVIPGSQKSPYSVAEAISNQSKTDVWVIGYIVGSFDGSINKFIPGTTGASGSNIAFADSPNEEDVSKMIPVQLSSTKVKAVLNLKDNPEMLGRHVKIKGDLDTYYSAPGLKLASDFSFPE